MGTFNRTLVGMGQFFYFDQKRVGCIFWRRSRRNTRYGCLSFPIANGYSKTPQDQQTTMETVISVWLLGNFFPAFLFAIAETQLSSALTGILNALTPLFVLVVGLLFFNQKLGFRTGLGLIIGLAGTLYLVFTGSSDTIGNVNFHVVYVLLATLCYGINLNILKYYLHDLSAKEITSISLLLVGPIGIIYLFSATDFTMKLAMYDGAWEAFFYVVILGVVGTAIALLFFNRLVKITSPVFTSFVTYLIPIVAVAWGILNNEVVRASHYIGMVVIIAGIFIAGRQNRGQ